MCVVYIMDLRVALELGYIDKGLELLFVLVAVNL